MEASALSRPEGAEKERLTVKWSPDHRLFLVYKDDLVRQKGLLSSARASGSLTIELHRALAGATPPTAQQTLFEPFVRYNGRYANEMPSTCCVWGLWRKNWGSH